MTSPVFDFVPASIELFGHQTKLHDEIAGEILRRDLAALFLPQPDQRCLVIAHDDAGVGAADEVAAIRWF